jgi:putative hydrolase of HD superfamily
MTDDKTINPDINLLFEIGSLCNVPRGWRQHLGLDCASVLEHTLRVAWLALIIARREGRGDEGRILRLALIHDLSETRTSDLSYVQKVYAQADDQAAVDDSLKGTSLADYAGLFKEYETRDSIEAKIVKDADNLDIDLELKELEEKGSRLPAKLSELRRVVRDQQLHTESARRLWDEIQAADISDWHLKANKLVKKSYFA